MGHSKDELKEGLFISIPRPIAIGRALTRAGDSIFGKCLTGEDLP